MHIIRSITKFSVDKIDRLYIFSFMWAIAMLFHQFIYFHQWLYTKNTFGILLTIAALLLLIRPHSILLFLGMVILSVSYGINKLPFLSNHIFFQWSVDFLILLSIGWLLFNKFRRKGLNEVNDDKDFRNQIFESFAPLARIALIILYFFAVFHKLNWGFLDPNYSHGANLLHEMSGLMPFIPINEGTKWFSIWSTLIVESAIPIMLCFRRTRNAGIVFAILFHLSLCLNPHRAGFTSFTSMLFALFFLYTPKDFPQLLTDYTSKIYRQSIEGRAKWVIIYFLIFALLFSAACIILIYYKEYKSIAVVFLVGYGVLFATVFSIVMYKNRAIQDNSTNYFHLRWPLQWFGVLLLLLNGMSPYLGLKTFATFNMFTNLRTEGGYTNHIFMPLLNLAHYQEDLVEILETNHPDFKKYAPQKQMLTYFEFQRMLIKSNGNYYVSYKRNGNTYYLDKNILSKKSETFDKQPWWKYKLLGFKPVDYGPHCLH